MTICLNCDNEFEGEFCNLCGQRASTHRFTIREWGREIPHKVLNIEKGFFGTIKALFLRPGISIREYLKGRRKLLISPFLYVLVMCGIYIVLSSLVGQNSEAEVKDSQTIEKNILAAVQHIQTYYYKIIIVAMIFPMTLGSFLAYFKSGFNFAENLVLNAYLIGQLVIGDMILILVASIFDVETNKGLLALLDLLLKYPYWFWVYYRFFRPGKWYIGILQFLFSLVLMNISLIAMLFAVAMAFLFFQN